MKADNFSLPSYLNRIGFHRDAKADITTIAEIMRSQLFTVPFENLDVQAGKIVSLVPEEIVDKIINNNRGGYCYEVNGLFAMALEALGITYQFVAARPMFYPVKRPKTHMAIVLTLDNEQWLCDLGFGSYGIRAPIALSQLDVEISQDYDLFMLSKITEHEYLLKAFVEGDWTNQFAFNLSEQEWIDFVPANYLNSTHPDAIFVQKLLVLIHNADGKQVLLGDTLKTISKGEVTIETITPDQHASILSTHFGLDIHS